MKGEDLISIILGKDSTGKVFNSPAWIIPCRGERLMFVLAGANTVHIWSIRYECGGLDRDEYADQLLFTILLADPNSIEQLNKIKREGKDANLNANQVSG